MGNNHKPFIDSEMLSAYLDDALGTSERKAVEAHLAASGAARRELAELQRSRDVFDMWKAPDPDPFFVQRVAIRIAHEAPHSAWRRPWYYKLGHRVATAAMVLFAVGALVFLNHYQQKNVEHVTLEVYLRGFLDRDVRAVTTLSGSELSKDVVLDMVLSGNVR